MKNKVKVNRVNYIKSAVFAVLCLRAAAVTAQAPEIRIIDKPYAFPSQVVSISGLNFGSNPSQLAVFFGGIKGTINSVSDQLLEVQAPFGTTHNKISIFNTVSGLGSSTRESFFTDFGGTHPFNSSNLKIQVDFAADVGLYDQ